MNHPELQELLQRCDRDQASPADLEALEALLVAQDRDEGWGAIRAGLQAGLEAEAPSAELARPVVQRVAPGAEGGVPAALAVLAEGLLRVGDRVDVATAVLREVAPEHVGVPATLLDSLRSGLEAEAAGVQVADAVMHFVAPSPDALLEAHMAALRAELAGVGHQAEAPAFTRALIDTVAPERERSLDQAFELLASRLAELHGEVELVQPVMQAVLASEARGLELCALADGELSSEQRRVLAARLSDDPASRREITAFVELGRQLRHALAHETAEADLAGIWPAVEVRLGLAEQGAWASLAEGIREEAGEIDIADLVMDSILEPARAPEPVEPADPVEPEPVRQPQAIPWFRRFPLLGFAASAAALLFVLNTMTPPQPGIQAPVGPGEPVAEVAGFFRIEADNRAEIEELEVAQDAMVQVFQLEDGAPMVIFIEEGLEPDSPEGVTL